MQGSPNDIRKRSSIYEKRMEIEKNVNSVQSDRVPEKKEEILKKEHTLQQKVLLAEKEIEEFLKERLPEFEKQKKSSRISNLKEKLDSVAGKTVQLVVAFFIFSASYLGAHLLSDSLDFENGSVSDGLFADAPAETDEVEFLKSDNENIVQIEQKEEKIADLKLTQELEDQISVIASGLKKIKDESGPKVVIHKESHKESHSTESYNKE